MVAVFGKARKDCLAFYKKEEFFNEKYEWNALTQYFRLIMKKCVIKTHCCVSCCPCLNLNLYKDKIMVVYSQMPFQGQYFYLENTEQYV